MIVAAATVVVGACASGSSDEPRVAEQTETSTTIADVPPTDETPPDEPGPIDEPTVTAAEADDESDDEAVPSTGVIDSGDDASTEPRATDVPAPAPGSEPEPGPSVETTDPPAPPGAPTGYAWPEDGCSADNSPTPLAVASPPAPAIDVRPESVGNALPDLAVRRINCNGGWVNLKNELPSEKPLLVWFWAPH